MSFLPASLFPLEGVKIRYVVLYISSGNIEERCSSPCTDALPCHSPPWVAKSVNLVERFLDLQADHMARMETSKLSIPKES